MTGNEFLIGVGLGWGDFGWLLHNNLLKCSYFLLKNALLFLQKARLKNLSHCNTLPFSEPAMMRHPLAMDTYDSDTETSEDESKDALKHNPGYQVSWQWSETYRSAGNELVYNWKSLSLGQLISINMTERSQESFLFSRLPVNLANSSPPNKLEQLTMWKSDVGAIELNAVDGEVVAMGLSLT